MSGGRAVPVLAAGVLLLVVLALLGAAGFRVMPSYLAAWLFVLSVPVGALLLVTGVEAFGESFVPAPDAARLPHGGAVLQELRALLPLLPVAALCGVPVLLLSGSLFPADAWPADGIGRIWFGRAFFDLRMVVFLLAWSGMAVLFAAAPRPGARRGVAGIAFGLNLAIGTLAAIDWAMAVEPGLASSSFGLLVMSGQALSALAVAALLAGPVAAGRAALPLLVLLSAWLFLNLTQFLVVWSANKPAEAEWYLRRIGGLGAAGLWFAAGVLVLAMLLLSRRDAGRFVVPLAALVLLLRLVESFWLITPGFRGAFTLTAADLVAFGGTAALLAGLQRGGWLAAAERRAHVGS